MPSPHASSASSSHQIMARRGHGFLDQKPRSPSSFVLPGPVRTSALSALSDSQTAEVWDPLPDLPIISQRNATNEALWGTDAERAAWAKTTCHSHLMITHTHTHGYVTGAFRADCLCVFVYMLSSCHVCSSFCKHPRCEFSLMTHLIYFSSFKFSLVSNLFVCGGVREDIHYWPSFLYISGRRDAPQHLVCNFRKGWAVQNTLSLIFPKIWSGLLLQYGSNIRCDVSTRQE